MSEIYLTPFSPSLGSALAKALTPAQYGRIDRGMKPPMTQQQAVDRASDTNPASSVFPTGNQAVPTNMHERIDAITNPNPRSNMPTGQREFELGQSARGSLGPQNRLIQERNRSPISNISRDVGSAARRGMDRAASSLAPMADAARARFSDVGQSVSEGAQAAGQAAGQAMGRAGAAMGATASNVASQIPGMAGAARQRFNQTGEAIGQGARQLGQTIGQGATQARDAMNRGAMNVASKIPGMARAAGRMVGTAGRKFGEAAQTARERMTSPKMREFAATARESGGAMLGDVGRGVTAAGKHAGNMANTSYGVAQDIAGQGMKYGAKGARVLMGTNNQMANQPLQNQPSQSRSAPFGNNKTSESEGEEQPQQAAPSGYTPNQGMLDNLYQQNIDRSQTRGGVGTGIMSNLLTGGLSGLARGAYNMRQRNIGRQNLQNLNQYGGGAVPFLRSEYDTMSDRTIIRSRMTTEAIRSAYVI